MTTTIDELVDALRAVDGVRAETDESKLNLPGIWVRPVRLRRDSLGGKWTTVVQIRLMVPDSGADRARDALLALFEKVSAVADPDDDPQFATVTRPSGGSAVPALVYPLDLLP